MSSAPSAGTRPIGVSSASAWSSQRSKTHASTRLFSPKPGHRKWPSSSLRNQLTMKIFGSSAPSRRADLEPVRRSSRPCGSRRRAASPSGRSAARRPRRPAAAVFSEPMIEPMKTPCSQSNASVTSGTTAARRPPNRNASIGTPFGSSQSSAIDGHWAAGVVKRAFGCAAGRVRRRASSPRRASRSRGPAGRDHPLPPHVAVVGERAVREDRVLAHRGHRVRVRLLATCRARRRRSPPRG